MEAVACFKTMPDPRREEDYECYVVNEGTVKATYNS